MTTDSRNFRQRLRVGEPLLGTFIKSAGIHSIEIIGAVGYDFAIVDNEHAPFDRGGIDVAMCAARAARIEALVRVPDLGGVLSVLDCGATGVLVPHVDSPQRAQEAVATCRYRGGTRGFSSGGRAGDYGAHGLWEHVDRQDARTTVIAMIEDPKALDCLEAIAAVEGIDGFFIGRADLTVALGAQSTAAPEVLSAVERISRAGHAAGKGVLIMATSAEEARRFRGMGATAFVVDSDQAFMRRAATAALQDFRTLAK